MTRGPHVVERATPLHELAEHPETPVEVLEQVVAAAEERLVGEAPGLGSEVSSMTRAPRDGAE